MGHVGRAGGGGRGRECASAGAIRGRGARHTGPCPTSAGPMRRCRRKRRVPDYAPGYGPRLLPPHEVYTVLRESGFSPLGIPLQRGFVYTISVIDRGGDDGRLVIDARTGRILRFLPANRMGDNFDDELTTTYGPPGPPPPVGDPGASRARRARSRRLQAARPGCRFQSRAPTKRGRWPRPRRLCSRLKPRRFRRSSSRPRRCRPNRPIRRPPARSPLPRPPRPSRPSPRRRSCRRRTCRRRRGWNRAIAARDQFRSAGSDD